MDSHFKQPPIVQPAFWAAELTKLFVKSTVIVNLISIMNVFSLSMQMSFQAPFLVSNCNHIRITANSRSVIYLT